MFILQVVCSETRLLETGPASEELPTGLYGSKPATTNTRTRCTQLAS